MIWLLVAQLAAWQAVKPPVLHQGSWQSCDHAESVLEHRVLGVFKWEMHLGPDDEFAVYTHQVDGDHTHEGRENMLAPAFRISDADTWRGKRQWTVPSLHLWISIVRAGGSRDTCQSFYVRIEDHR